MTILRSPLRQPIRSVSRAVPGGGEAITPADLTLSAWYDPSDLTTLFQDSGATTPVAADGDPVGYMADKSGNGLHLTQSTSGSRPVYKTSGGLHWLDFDGTDDRLVGSALSGYITATTYETIVAGRADTIGTNNAGQNEAIWGDEGGYAGVDFRSSGVVRLYNFDASNDAATAAYTAASNVVLAGRHEGGVLYASANGGSLASAASGDTQVLTGAFQLGRQFNTNTLCLDGRFYGGIWSKSILSASDRAALIAFFMAKAGL